MTAVVLLHCCYPEHCERKGGTLTSNVVRVGDGDEKGLPTKRQEAEMEVDVADLKMLRFSLEVTRMGKTRNV